MQKELKEIRTKILKRSQEDLAHELGMTVATYAKKEKYSRPLKATELMDIARLAGLDPREIKII